MSLRDRLSVSLKEAMKAKDATRLMTLRLINAAIKDRDIDARSEGTDAGVSDDDLLAILSKMVKQRQESARAYEEGGRLELAEKERAEIVIVEEFLPRQLSEQEVEKAIAEAITERYQDMDELFDLGEIDLHISGCINSCGHHHSGHIGILGVDKDGLEWYQVSLGGADGSTLSGTAVPGKVVGPSFSASEVPEVIEAVLETYRHERQSAGAAHETFIQTLRRVGLEPFKTAAQSARYTPQEVV